MGCCLGTSGTSDYSEEYENERSCPLSQEQIKWKSKEPLTEAQLAAKRQEFWETSPAFEGRQEIWDALRAAASHAELGDFAFAQVIIDGANIYLPYGSLTESYDELGCRYVVPNFCLSRPTNLVDEESGASRKSFADEAQREARRKASRTSVAKSRRRYCCAFACCPRRRSYLSQKKTGERLCRHSRNRTDRGSQCGYRPVLTAEECCQLVGVGSLVRLRLRLSTNGAEIPFDAALKEPIGRLKWRLHYLFADSQSVPVPQQQRWLYGGRLLSDRMTVEQCRIAPQFVVQVVISVPDVTELPTSPINDASRVQLESAQIENAADEPDDLQHPSVTLNVSQLTGSVRLRNNSVAAGGQDELTAQLASESTGSDD